MNQQTSQNPSTPVEPESSIKDLQPQEDVKGGLLPAIQKAREAAFTGGGG